jgi:hypothetical protein
MNMYLRTRLKYFMLCLIAMAWNGALLAQSTPTGVGIGIENPDENAILDITVTGAAKGLLIPRLDNGKIGTFPAALAEGMLVYNTTYHNFQYWYNGKWENVGTPRGGIIMWSGSSTTLPNGWVLCDGRRYLKDGTVDASGINVTAIVTPNLQGRFIVGYQSTNTAYDQPGNLSSGNTTTPGETGGLETVTLSAAQSGLRAHEHDVTITSHAINVSPHTHGVNDPGHSHLIHTGRDGGNGEITREDAQSSSDKTTKTATTGISIQSTTTNITIANHTVDVLEKPAEDATASHENRPPYYVLAFIMKL